MYKYKPTFEEFELECKDISGNLLLLGGERTGKTTLASILVKRENTENVLYINSLKEQGIQYYRNEVKCFCQTNSHQKIVVIDSLDDINEQAQQIFLNYIDKYPSVQFIATGTTPQKIIESMFSRFIVVKMKRPSDEYIQRLIHKVIEKETIKLDEDAIPYLMSISDYSVYTILNYLEKFKIMNMHITREYIQKTHTNIHSETFEQFTHHVLQKDYTNAIKSIVHLHTDGYSIMDILDAYYVFINRFTCSDDFKYNIVKIICKYTVIFNNVHEHCIELLFFVEDCINIASELHSSHK
jgi:replication-associated recombination protein RarA